MVSLSAVSLLPFNFNFGLARSMARNEGIRCCHWHGFLLSVRLQPKFSASRNHSGFTDRRRRGITVAGAVKTPSTLRDFGNLRPLVMVLSCGRSSPRGEPNPAGTGASRLALRCYIGNSKSAERVDRPKGNSKLSLVLVLFSFRL